MDDGVRSAARARLRIGFWLVLAGAFFGLLGIVAPSELWDRPTPPLDGDESAAIIDHWNSTLLVGLSVLGCVALAFLAWEMQRGWMWPICIVGLLAALMGTGLAISSEEWTRPGPGAWFMLAAGVLLFVGGLTLTLVLRSLRIEAAVEAKVKEQVGADVLPAPMAELPPEGWYADPKDPTGSRWWDGGKWTDARRSGATNATQSAPPVG